WVTCTRLTPEGPLDAAGRPVGECRAEAIALALVPPNSPLARLRVEWAPGELATLNFAALVALTAREVSRLDEPGGSPPLAPGATTTPPACPPLARSDWP